MTIVAVKPVVGRRRVSGMGIEIVVAISCSKHMYNWDDAASHEVLLSIREFDDSAMFIHHDNYSYFRLVAAVSSFTNP